MIKYSHTDDIEDDLEDDRRFSSTHIRRFNTHILILQKMIKLISMMKMYDDVPKLPMTLRVSPVSCTIVVVAVATTVEYLPN